MRIVIITPQLNSKKALFKTVLVPKVYVNNGVIPQNCSGNQNLFIYMNL